MTQIEFDNKEVKHYLSDFARETRDAKIKLEQLETENDAESYYELGQLLENNRTVRDLGRALKYYNLASELGYVTATLHLAKAYITKRDEMRDRIQIGVYYPEIALDYFIKACKQGADAADVINDVKESRGLTDLIVKEFFESLRFAHF